MVDFNQATQKWVGKMEHRLPPSQGFGHWAQETAEGEVLWTAATEKDVPTWNHVDDYYKSEEDGYSSLLEQVKKEAAASTGTTTLTPHARITSELQPRLPLPDRGNLFPESESLENDELFAALEANRHVSEPEAESVIRRRYHGLNPSSYHNKSNATTEDETQPTLSSKAKDLSKASKLASIFGLSNNTAADDTLKYVIPVRTSVSGSSQKTFPNKTSNAKSESKPPVKPGDSNNSCSDQNQTKGGYVCGERLRFNEYSDDMLKVHDRRRRITERLFKDRPNVVTEEEYQAFLEELEPIWTLKVDQKGQESWHKEVDS